MLLGFLIVFFFVALALAAPFAAMALLGAAIFRTHRARAWCALRESVQLSTVFAIAFGVLGWALVPYMVDTLSIATVFGTTFTLSSLYLGSKWVFFHRSGERVDDA